MQSISQALSLNLRPLIYFKPLFVSLAPPALAELPGLFQAEFTGPAWLRGLAGPSLALGGLGGWWGKEFGPVGAGFNLVHSREGLERRFPFEVNETKSALDGRPTLAVHYLRPCPFPWPMIVDELRCLEAGCLLGMTYLNVGPVKKLAFPFLLYRREKIDGAGL